MTRLFGRTVDLVKANVLALLESAEDPEKMLNLYLEEARNHLAESGSAVHTALATERDLESQLRSAQSEESTWGKRAELAVTKGDDALAREIIAEKQKAHGRVEQLSGVVATAREQATKARNELHALQVRVHDAEMNHSVLIARAKMAKARKATAEALGKIGSGESVAALDSYAGKVGRLEAEADASAELSGVGNPSLEERAKALDGDSVDEELTALKQKLGKG